MRRVARWEGQIVGGIQGSSNLAFFCFSFSFCPPFLLCHFPALFLARACMLVLSSYPFSVYKDFPPFSVFFLFNISTSCSNDFFSSSVCFVIDVMISFCTILCAWFLSLFFFSPFFCVICLSYLLLISGFDVCVELVERNCSTSQDTTNSLSAVCGMHVLYIFIFIAFCLLISISCTLLFRWIASCLFLFPLFHFPLLCPIFIYHRYSIYLSLLFPSLPTYKT